MSKKLLFLLVICVLVLIPVLSPLHPSRAAQDTVEITFVHIFPDDRDIRRTTIQEIADQFMAEHPNVKINIKADTDSYGEVFNNAMLAADQGNPPDVIQVEDTLVQIAIDSQRFVKIGDYATEEQLASVADIISPMRNYYHLDKEICGLPWNASNPIMYYNPDIFTAAGLDPEKPPTTFDELTAACEQIKAANIEGLTACVNWPVTSWLPEQWTAMQGGLFVNNDNGHSDRATEALLTSPEMLYIMTWWKSMADNGYYTWTGQPQAYTPEGLMFVSKKVANHISTSAGLSNILSFSNTMGKFTPRVAPLPLPTPEATNGVTPGGGSLWVLAGHSEEQTRAAVDWVFFLTNTQNDKAWHKASGYFPVRQSSIDELTAEGWYDEHPEYRIALDQILNAAPNPATAGTRIGAYAQVRDAVMNAAQSIIDSGEDPAAALESAKQRADQAIKEYNDVIGG